MVASFPVLGKHKALLKGRKPSVELIPLAKVLCAAVFEVAKFAHSARLVPGAVGFP